MLIILSIFLFVIACIIIALLLRGVFRIDAFYEQLMDINKGLKEINYMILKNTNQDDDNEH